MFPTKVVCPKCGASCVVPNSNGTRCNQCGHQTRGIVKGFTVPLYIPKETPRKQNIHHSLSDQEKNDFLNLWKELGTKQVAIDTNTPRVSIVVPTYKRQHTLYFTIASVLQQTHKNWELIIIDNEKKSRYQFSNSRIKYYTYSEKQSASYARNRGVEHAAGELICFIDDDDIMAPDYLERMLIPFADQEVKCVSCNIRLVEDEIPPHRHFCTPTVVMRREYASPTWGANGAHDRYYFDAVVSSLPDKAYIEINETLVFAYTEPEGGLRGKGATL